MQLKDVHKDMERFLEQDCYCPNEIYEVNGFFFELFPPETECEVVTSTEDATVVVACSPMHDEPGKPQCIYFWHDDGSGRIIAAQKVDATENNIGILKDMAHGVEPDGRKIDEFNPGATAESLRKMMSFCDIIMVD